MYNNAYPLLLIAAKKYDGSKSFFYFAGDYIRKNFKMLEPPKKVKLLETNEIFEDWINGLSSNKIAKKYDMSVQQVMRKIKKTTERIIINDENI